MKERFCDKTGNGETGICDACQELQTRGRKKTFPGISCCEDEDESHTMSERCDVKQRVCCGCQKVRKGSRYRGLLCRSFDASCRDEIQCQSFISYFTFH